MEIKRVTVQEAVDLIKNNKNIKILDTRTFAEVRSTGFIKGSMLIDTSLPTLEDEILKLDRNESYLLYCARGKRAFAVSEFMIRNGFTSLYSLWDAGYSELALALKDKE